MTRKLDPTGLDQRSMDLRCSILRMLEKARRGHVGSAFSVIEILRVLYDDVLRYDPKNPAWEDRDRFILSKGHGCLGLYAVLADKGFIPPAELERFCADGAMLGGHPEYGKVPGVEASTGSLGHGLAIGVGFALWGKMTGRDFRTFVLLGDGECQEGAVWEAALTAAKHRLSQLTALVDYNKMQSYSTTAEVLDLDPFARKWESFGFVAHEVDGHDVAALRRLLGAAPERDGRPLAVICHTVKGKGAPSIEHDPAWHHKAKISEEELRRLRDELGMEST